jgi:hypothetical protein
MRRLKSQSNARPHTFITLMDAIRSIMISSVSFEGYLLLPD